MRKLLAILLTLFAVFGVAPRLGFADIGENLEDTGLRYGTPLFVHTPAGNIFTWEDYADSSLTARYYIFRFIENGMLIEAQVSPGVNDSESKLNPKLVVASERFTFDRPVPLAELGKYLNQPVRLLKDSEGVAFTSLGYQLPVGEDDQLAFTVAVALPAKGLLVGLVLEYGQDIDIVQGRYDLKPTTRVRQVYVGKLDSFIFGLYKGQNQPDRNKVQTFLRALPEPTVSDRLETGRRALVATRLKDIQTHWAKDAIVELINKGIVSGYPDNSFRPEEPISRAAFVKMLVSVRGIAPEVSVTPFADLAGHWVQPYVSAAVKAGIIIPTEYPDGRFDPDRAITRVEIAAMVSRALGLAPAPEKAQVFVDVKDIVPGFAGYVGAVAEYRIVTGYPDGTFGPNLSATRAQAAIIVSRLINTRR
jgi:hypothetical protein